VFTLCGNQAVSFKFKDEYSKMEKHMEKIKKKKKKGRVQYDSNVLKFPGSKLFGSTKEKFLDKRS
jgi:hypothetical protein